MKLLQGNRWITLVNCYNCRQTDLGPILLHPMLYLGQYANLVRAEKLKYTHDGQYRGFFYCDISFRRQYEQVPVIHISSNISSLLESR